MIAFEVLKPNDIPAAVVALVDAARRCGPYDFSVGPFDDKRLLSDRQVFVEGPDEVEGAELLGAALENAGVAYRAL